MKAVIENYVAIAVLALLAGLFFWLFSMMLSCEIGTTRLSYLTCVLAALSIRCVAFMITGVHRD